MSSVIRIPPLNYVHVLDNNLGVTRVVVGPKTITKQDHETLVVGPVEMVVVPQRKYAVLSNPVKRDAEGAPVFDANGNYVLRHGDSEIRMFGPPFPLYPGEALEGPIQPLMVVAPNAALRLRCVRDTPEHKAGDEWLWKGPGTYLPSVDITVVETVRSTLVRRDEALRLRARRECAPLGIKREAGEEWLVSEPGAYLPDVDEEVIGTVKATVLTPCLALHLRALKAATDCFGVRRKAGAEWLVTSAMTASYIPGVAEEPVGEVHAQVMHARQYCVVLNPCDKNGVPQLGAREVRRGPLSFFLHPGEALESGGVRDVLILSGDEALLLRARERVSEGGVVRAPGEMWLVRGPMEYVPPVAVDVVETRRAVPLDANEGVYVRDRESGRVTAVMGRAYMLSAQEELWAKPLPATVEELVMRYAGTPGAARDATRVVTLRAPHNTAVQVYDFRQRTTRVCFGPALVTLGPDEEFTLLSLSGGVPKAPHVVKDLCLKLGPETSTDVVVVETSDHARLSLRLSYSWQFDRLRGAPERLFAVSDFLGDFCKALAARVRGAVARHPFDAFHRSSASIIRAAVFQANSDTSSIVLVPSDAPTLSLSSDPNPSASPSANPGSNPSVSLLFLNSHLLISHVDIQSVEPVDTRTRDSLSRSVQLAIEITTKSQEATAKHASEVTDLMSRAALDRQRLADEAEAEKLRKELLLLGAAASEVEASGQAQAEALARAEAVRVEARCRVEVAEWRAKEMGIRERAERERERAMGSVEEEVEEKKAQVEKEREQALAEVESERFERIMAAIGQDTMREMARVGPEQRARMLKGLGIESMIITDGKAPIELMGTAEGLMQTVVKRRDGRGSAKVEEVE